MRSTILILTCLVACGDDSDDATDDGPPPADVCTDQPCLTEIKTTADWEAVSQANDDERCDVIREGKYILPASDAAELQTAVFQDVKVVPFHVEFMRTVLADYFPGLTPASYAQLVQKRATRKYYAGAIYQIRDRLGTDSGWGFDVIVDPTSDAEQLSEDEIWALQLQLIESFELQALFYAPREPRAIAKAQSFTGNLVWAVYPRTDCVESTCDDDSKWCLEIPTATTLCGGFNEGRSIQLEYEYRAQIQLAAGDYKLPRDGSPAELTLVTGGTIGPEREPITSLGPGSFVREVFGDYETFHYSQPLRARGQDYTFRWEFQFSPTTSRAVVVEPWISNFLYAGMNTADPETSWETRINTGTCSGEGLESWKAEAQFTGGDSLRIDLAYAPPLAGSGPLIPLRAHVSLGGESFLVDDYYDLAYAGVHHNWDNQFWVVFDEPRSFNGHDIFGLWIDEADYTPNPVEIFTLDENLAKLDTLAVDLYSREKVGP